MAYVHKKNLCYKDIESRNVVEACTLTYGRLTVPLGTQRPDHTPECILHNEHDKNEGSEPAFLRQSL